MPYPWRPALASLALFLTAQPLFPAPVASGGQCQVSKVVDGDTLHLTCAGVVHKVRLLGYDTPEIYHPHCPAEKQAGEAATVLMQRLVASGQVTEVRFGGLDRYGRDLADVEIGGQDVAGFMLASPLALPYAGHRHPDWCHLLGS